MFNTIINSITYDAYITGYFINNQYFYNGIKYIDGNVEKYDIDNFVKELSLGSNNKYIKDHNGYKVYCDLDTGYYHYLKDGIEDFLMFFLNNGESILEFKNGNSNKSLFKRFHIKDKVIKTTALMMLLSTLIFIDNSIPLNMYDYSNTKQFIESNIAEVTPEEVRTLLNSNDFVRENNLYDSNDLLELVLPYITSPFRKSVLRDSLNRLEFRYYDKNDIMYETSNGYHNPLIPNVINIKDTRIDDFETYDHEYIHLLQDSNLMYLKESTAELLSHEFFDDEVTSYSDEVKVTRLLVETIGTDPILKAVFGNDPTDLFNILEQYLEVEDYERLKELLTKRISDDFREQMDVNNEVDGLVKKLYKNMYNEDMEDNRDIFMSNRYHPVYKVYFNPNRKIQVMHYFKAYRYGLIKFERFYLDYEYVKENNIDNYFYDEEGKVYINILVPAIDGVSLDGEMVYFESKGIKADELSQELIFG